MKKIIIIFLLFCSFASAIDIDYGDGNCDFVTDINDINIMLDLLSNKSVEGRCCLNETMTCVNMDINMNGTFDSNDLVLLSDGIFGTFTLPKYTNYSVQELLNFYVNVSINNNTVYIQNYTMNYTNATQDYCNDNYNITVQHTNISCMTCPTCPAPVTNTVEVEKIVTEEKEVIWNWKVVLLILFTLILGFTLGYTYAINYGDR